MKRIVLFVSAVVVMGISTDAVFAGGSQEESRPERLVYLTPPWGAPSDDVVAAFEAATGIELEVATVDID
ncbi:MAG: hypothetical protein MI724_00580, partial [Spirochaetales bacterium]|nr:hypothetical protein [Spirochaetales bacterium]